MTLDFIQIGFLNVKLTTYEVQYMTILTDYGLKLIFKHPGEPAITVKLVYFSHSYNLTSLDDYRQTYAIENA